MASSIYPGLTSFRFLAFCVVFLFHNAVLPLGYISLQSFFVLSGFLITAILVEMKQSHAGKDYFITFYKRRVLRIFPLYYIYLLVIALVAAPFFFPSHNSIFPEINRFYHQLGWASSYTYNFFHASNDFKRTQLLTHFWSLAIEEQFYLLWPIAIYHIPQRHLKKFLLTIIFAAPIMRWVSGELAVSGAFPWLSNDAGLVVYVLPFSHFDAFAIGGFFALYGKPCANKTIWLLLIGTILLGVAISAVFESYIDWWGFADFMGHSHKYIWGYTLFNLCFALMLINIRERQSSGGFLGSEWLVYLGSISYGLYIFHNGFIWLVNQALPACSLPTRMLVSFLLTILLAALSYRYLEKPCLQLKDRFAPSPRL